MDAGQSCLHGQSIVCEGRTVCCSFRHIFVTRTQIVGRTRTQTLRHVRNKEDIKASSGQRVCGESAIAERMVADKGTGRESEFCVVRIRGIARDVSCRASPAATHHMMRPVETSVHDNVNELLDIRAQRTKLKQCPQLGKCPQMSNPQNNFSSTTTKSIRKERRIGG